MHGYEVWSCCVVRAFLLPNRALQLPKVNFIAPRRPTHGALHGRRRPTAGGAELGARVARRVRVVVNLAWFEVARATRPPA